jgi:ATP/maltotriose-dependent transcriptional regulator MalT
MLITTIVLAALIVIAVMFYLITEVTHKVRVAKRIKEASKMIDRKTWLTQTKQRALTQLESGDVRGAIDTMIETLDKHPDTALGSQTDILRKLGEVIADRGQVDEALDYIKGFN